VDEVAAADVDANVADRRALARREGEQIAGAEERGVTIDRHA
jgi:hypothetical protein